MLEDYKRTIRVFESILEIACLTGVFFLLWSQFYRGRALPMYLGRGKWILTSVYVMLMTVVFVLSDGFKFGHKKPLDVTVSQILA